MRVGFTRPVAGRARLRALIVMAFVLAACSTGNNSNRGGAIVGDGRSGSGPPSSSASGSEGTALLNAPAGTDKATLASAADVVWAHLTRMGVADATVTVQDDGLAVRSSANGYQLHATGQHHATTIAPITSASVGACNGQGTPSTGTAARCYMLGVPVTGVSAV